MRELYAPRKHVVVNGQYKSRSNPCATSTCGMHRVRGWVSYMRLIVHAGGIPIVNNTAIRAMSVLYCVRCRKKQWRAERTARRRGVRRTDIESHESRLTQQSGRRACESSGLGSSDAPVGAGTRVSPLRRFRLAQPLAVLGGSRSVGARVRKDRMRDSSSGNGVKLRKT